MYHHGTIRKYTAALLDLFNDLEIQYEDSQGNVISRNIPVKYSSIEKTRVLDEYTSEQLASGNTNVLPRAALGMSTMVKADARVANKNVKIAKIKTEDSYEWMYNSVPYEFTFELAFICRGMNEAMMIVEQIAPKFNPTINIDVWDATNLDEPTRVPVKLLDIGIEQSEYDETSSNLVLVNCGLSIMGNLYPPVRTIERIKEFKMNINELKGDFFVRKEIMGWDVNEAGALENGEVLNLDRKVEPPQIISITGTTALGANTLTAIVDNIDYTQPTLVNALDFEWSVLFGDATIEGNKTSATLVISDYGYVEVQLTVTDYFNNYSTFARKFYVYENDGDIPTDLNSNIDDTAIDLQVGTSAADEDLDLPFDSGVAEGDLATTQGFLDLSIDTTDATDLLTPYEDITTGDAATGSGTFDLNTDGENPLDLDS